MVVRDLLHVAAPRRHAHQPAHEGFIDAHGLGDVAHARRPVGLAAPACGAISAQIRSSSAENLTWWPGRRTHVRSSATSPASASRLDGGQRKRRRQHRFISLRSCLEPDAGQVRPLGMEAHRASVPTLRPQPLPGRTAAWRRARLCAGRSRAQSSDWMRAAVGGADARGRGQKASRSIQRAGPGKRARQRCSRIALAPGP